MKAIPYAKKKQMRVNGKVFCTSPYRLLDEDGNLKKCVPHPNHKPNHKREKR